jgi:hypothetical protein
MRIRLYSFPLITLIVLAVLTILGDRALDTLMARRQITGMVLIALILEVLVIALLVIWHIKEKRKSRKGDEDQDNV